MKYFHKVASRHQAIVPRSQFKYQGILFKKSKGEDSILFVHTFLFVIVALVTFTTLWLVRSIVHMVKLITLTVLCQDL